MDERSLILTFFIYGFISNLIGLLVMYISLEFKLQALTRKELTSALAFILKRKVFIVTNASLINYFNKFITILFPFHILGISIFFVYNLIIYRGDLGVFMAFKETENKTLFPFVQYK